MPAELHEMGGEVVLATVPDVATELRDWFLVRSREGDWVGKVSKSDWASFSKPLSDWQLKLLGEAYEVGDRMANLTALARGPALVPPLSFEDHGLINRQWWAMDTYHRVLRERIARFVVQTVPACS